MFDFQPSSSALKSTALLVASSVLHPSLFGGVGVAAVLAGGTLACRAYSKDGDALQTTAGFLLITGFACLGVAVYLIGGSPF
ncbi:MAG: hypothetical protein ACM3PO_10575 [Betaproteobacteria bacterium]